MDSHDPHYHDHGDGAGEHDSDTERHASVKKDLTLRATGNAPAAPVYAAVIVALLPMVMVFEAQPRAFDRYELSRPPPVLSPPGISLPHTVALLI